MQRLFNKYYSSGKISDALLIGQNFFNRESSNKEAFEIYFNLLISLATKQELHLKERELYSEQAAEALAFFSENALLDENMIEYINQQRHLLQATIASNQKETLQHNDEAMNLIEKLVSKLGGRITPDEYERLVKQIGQIDATINQSLSPDQQQRYTELTKRCAEIVEQKAREFQHKKNIQYNLDAIEAYERIFRFFKEKEDFENHEEIIKGLFDFDASRLTNETLVYYNHVYSYILGKLNDAGKFALTKYAIMSEKRR